MTAVPNILQVIVDGGKCWCRIEGFEDLERTHDDEFRTSEWREVKRLKHETLELTEANA